MHETRIVNGSPAIVIDVDTMRKSDAFTIANCISGQILMGRAAKGVLDAVTWQEPVAILAGGGNNGGDGYALSCLLAKRGIRPQVYQLSEKLSPDGAYYRQQALQLEIPITPWTGNVSLDSYEIVVDAILGTGFQGSVRGLAREAIAKINASGAYIVSVDIPSGLHGDTGEGELAVHADLTVSIGYRCV